MITVNFKGMINNHLDNGSGISLLVGFILAFSNGVFGWLANIHFTSNLNGWMQALILGVIGSTATFFTNKFWKFVEKKYKTHKQNI
jgi:uncharacterized membrane protein YeaQ/YmgE (transglycosylase-associated protein family)